MRIWQYTTLDPMGVGGVESHIRYINEGLKKSGHEVFVGTEMPDGLLTDGKNTIIHTHGDCFFPLKLFYKTKFQKHIKHIHVSHGTTAQRLLNMAEYLSFSAYKGIARDLQPIRMADAVMAVSREAKTEVEKYYRKNIIIKVIPNGVDENIFKPVASITSEPMLLFVGRSTDKVKNTDLLMKAFYKVSQEYPTLKLTLVPGEQGLTFQNVFNVGKKFGKDLAEYYSQARALVVCSWYEGDSIVVREAKAMGIPVIASDLPVLKENLSGYENAHFFNTDTPAEFREVIKKVCFSETQPTVKPSLRTWNDVTKELQSFYRELLG